MKVALRTVAPLAVILTLAAVVGWVVRLGSRISGGLG
jgi:hypothetical protein